MSPNSSKQLDHIDGRYRDLVLIAKRGLADAYEATDTTTGERVFLKIIRESKADDPHYFLLFTKEIMVLQEFANAEPRLPVPRLLSSGTFGRRPYFTLQLLKGWGLDVLLRQHIRLSANSIFRIIDASLEALSQLHNAGFVHGDISPDNIFIQTDSPVPTNGSLSDDFSLLLLDYNSSRRLDEDEGSASFRYIFLKLSYAAPELADGMKSSFRSDLYSLGVVLFELLVGTRPYSDPSSMSGVRSLRDAGIPKIPAVLEVPLPIENFVHRLLEGNPQKRIASAVDCLAEWREFKKVSAWLEQTDARQGLNFRLSSDSYLISGVSSVSTPEPVLENSPVTVTSPTAISEVQPQTGSEKIYESIGAFPVAASIQTDKFAGPDFQDEVSAIHTVPVPISVGNKEDVQLVDFSVFAPAGVRPDMAFILEFWAYLPASRDEAMERATRRGKIIERGARGPVYVPGRSELTIVLRLDGFEMQDTRDTIVWTSEITNLAFIVRVPSDLPAGDYPGQVSVIHDGLPLARVVFDITVGDRVCEQTSLKVERHSLKSAFASYASVDRDEVLRRVQGIRATGVDVFMDVLSLRAGEHWEDTLYDNIKSRDIFYLFWSKAARESEWVSREWRYALAAKGIDFIHPIPLVPPDKVPPPKELQSKHFNDIVLACMKSHELASII